MNPITAILFLSVSSAYGCVKTNSPDDMTEITTTTELITTSEATTVPVAPCSFCTTNVPASCDAVDSPDLGYGPLTCSPVTGTPTPSGANCLITFDCTTYPGTFQAFYKDAVNGWVTGGGSTVVMATCVNMAGTVGYTSPFGDTLTKFGCAEP